MKYYRIDWYSEEYKALLRGINNGQPLPPGDFWKEYQKWHFNYEDFTEFFQKVQGIVKGMVSNKADANKVLAAVSLLGKGVFDKMSVGNVELGVWEVE